MELIDKSALVAGIDNWRDEIIKSISDIPLTGRNRADATFEYEILGEVKYFLDFFEVKEVDFEKEWKEYFKYRGDVATVNIKHLAKHFFELGFKVHEEPKLTVDDIMRIDALLISMWHNKLGNNSYEEVLRQFKAQKGEKQ